MATSVRFPDTMKSFIVIVVFLLSLPVCAAPKVVVSIAPLHSLAMGVMDGVVEPDLLLQGNVSPHNFALRPSDVKKISEADLVFWVGVTMEGFMEKTLTASKAKSVALTDSLAVRLPPRVGGAWEAHDHDDDEHHNHDALDPHVWLDPTNAQAMVTVMEKTLIAADAEHAAQYRRNATAVRERLQALDQELTILLANDQQAPFIVFHDAFQYFEKRYHLHGIGSITVNSEQKPSAKRLIELRERIRESGVRCVFAEPQFGDGLINSVTEGSTVRRGTLDPLGMNEAPGKNAYFSMMRHLAQAAHLCLSRGS
jgi:ABC-type Zn2+ transport system, periplasmic component/surface adhesin